VRQAQRTIHELRGRQFDPEIVAAFEAVGADLPAPGLHG